ncbi:hypothetical protein [Streptomyces sp. NPDC059708]|uniref:hypothetical protein n=1 Tax=Streptomyces sp. NPDC059708 TaxID=3346916 RepID=UPI0036A35A14
MTAPTRPALSDTELAVLRGASEGQTYEALGRHLGFTAKSIGNVAMRVIDKFAASNITHAVLLACRAGILDGRPQRHGDHAGYVAHWRRGEDPKACGPCAAGERAHRAALRVVKAAAR